MRAHQKNVSICCEFKTNQFQQQLIVLNQQKSLSSAKFLNLALEMSANGLLITCWNIHRLTSDDILSFSSKEFWHKFILKNGGLYEKEAILQAVLDLITPFDLIPVKYTVDGDDAFFLARNCGQAIKKLCLNLLNPLRLKDAPREITLSIQTCSIPIEEYKMNMQFYLRKAIEKRYNESQKGFINLSSFHKDPELYEVLFCPLSKPTILVYVLSILKRLFTVTSIDLSNNNIEILKPLEILQEFKELIYLDLSNNKILDHSVADLLGKIAPNLQELSLRGNPVCSIFKTEAEYLKWIRNQNFALKKLDGISINYGLPNHQVYLCSEKSWITVNEFLKHYFTIYDKNRKILEHVYDENAIYSMICDHLPAEHFESSTLECYKCESKFLLKVKNQSKIMGSAYQKNSNIINVLLKLPLTEHDPYSFKVDVFFYQESFIVLMVSGIFKDFQDVPRLRSFNRTFALKRTDQVEFKIINDLYHVTNATEDEIAGSFLHSKPISEEAETGPLVTKSEGRKLTETVSSLTEMNLRYSKRCLEDCNWDLKRALEVFLENYEVFNIPPEAFAEDLSP